MISRVDASFRLQLVDLRQYEFHLLATNRSNNKPIYQQFLVIGSEEPLGHSEHSTLLLGDLKIIASRYVRRRTSAQLFTCCAAIVVYLVHTDGLLTTGKPYSAGASRKTLPAGGFLFFFNPIWAGRLRPLSALFFFSSKTLYLFNFPYCLVSCGSLRLFWQQPLRVIR